MNAMKLLMAGVLVALVGCSIIVDGRISDSLIVDCATEPEGTMCAEDAICRLDMCLPSTCGDAVVDPLRGEDCEDGNDIQGDGCEPGTCTSTCAADADCDDGDPCNGPESCSSANTCEMGTPPADGTISCDDGGLCVQGNCQPMGCGDGAVMGTEECDEVSAGCQSDCTWVCEADEDGNDGDVCDGAETCDVGTHTCLPGTALDCDDADDCTQDSCDARTGCLNGLIDADGTPIHRIPARLARCITETTAMVRRRTSIPARPSSATRWITTAWKARRTELSTRISSGGSVWNFV